MEHLINQVHNLDAFDLLALLPDASVDLIATDPPYNGVKDDAWDNQWATDADFITWLDSILREYKRVLKPNGSLYLFASPRMAARVEIAVQNHFNVLNNIRWIKDAGWHNKTDKEAIRGYLSPYEAIIFAEQYGSDEYANGEVGFTDAETNLKKRLFGDYLKSEFARAKVSNRDIAALFPSATGGLTGCVSNWVLGLNIPTSDQYHAMRGYLNMKSDGEYLRREYEYLRREYEELRRPFNVTAADPYTDVWTFKTVNAYDGKHPAEKPLDMMRHIIRVSSRPGAVVLDTFSGSGTTADAARREGRKFIACDFAPHWAAYGARRVTLPFTVSMFDMAI